MRIGLKLWSTNDCYAPLLPDLYEENCFDYVELYAFPGSFEQYSGIWESNRFPYVIHAPNDTINLAITGHFAENRESFKETQRYADYLGAEKIIIHAGLDGTIEESIKQLKLLGDRRLVIENVPLIGLKGQVCVGASPEEIGKVLDNCPCVKFCLDFGHAITYASCQNISYEDTIKNFNAMFPEIYHLCDGMFGNKRDRHLNLGAGEYDFRKILSFVPEGQMISLETPKKSKEDLDDFINDVKILRKCWKMRSSRKEKESVL